jgi:hypothetical protein
MLRGPHVKWRSEAPRKKLRATSRITRYTGAESKIISLRATPDEGVRGSTICNASLLFFQIHFCDVFSDLARFRAFKIG